MPTILREVVCDDGSIMIVEEQFEEESNISEDEPMEVSETSENTLGEASEPLDVPCKGQGDEILEKSTDENSPLKSAVDTVDSDVLTNSNNENEVIKESTDVPESENFEKDLNTPTDNMLTENNSENLSKTENLPITDNFNNKTDSCSSKTNNDNCKSDDFNSKIDHLNSKSDHLNSKSEHLNSKTDNLYSKTDNFSSKSGDDPYPIGPAIPINLNEAGTVDLNDLRFKCPECDKRVYRSDYLRMHINLHLSGQLQKSICESCGAQFGSMKELKAHRDSAHVKITCNVCYRRFSNTFKLRVHKLRSCTKCFKCDIVFPNAGLLRLHVKNHIVRKPGRPKSKKTSDEEISD